MSGQDSIEKACAGFWTWFRSAPHEECRDADCQAKLTALVREQVDLTMETVYIRQLRDRLAALEADLKAADESAAHWEAKFNATRAKVKP